MNSPGLFCLALLLCASTKGFPTDGSTSTSTRPSTSSTSTSTPLVTKAASPEPEEDTFTLPSASRKAPFGNSSSVSTTSSLLFKDKTPILTYLLGQPKKHGGLSSPAQLLSPDRYEFFTFDDDGQIVKKLMTVKEIQKIIANNERGAAEEHGTPVEYYQILTVTPDVESIPSVSRINPNEPLFSIHDVIASVQNVLRSEMKIKHSNPNTTGYVASASSDHFEILTEQPPFTFKVELPKSTSPPQEATTPATTFTLKQADATPQQENLPSVTHIPVPLVSSFKENAPVVEGAETSTSKPLSLSDAHPGFLSNDSFLDMKPITVVAEPILGELKSGSSGNFVKVETVERNGQPTADTSTAKVEMSITPDLADSVSSVLWQIASENSMLNGLNAATEATGDNMAATARESESSAVKTTSPTPTTQSRSTVEKLSESPLVTFGNVLIPQNRPRPFEKVPLIEKGTPEVAESRIEPFTPSYEPSGSSTVVVLGEEEKVKPETEVQNGTNDSSTAVPQTPVISVSPDAVVQSPEHVKPVTEKVVIANKTTSSGNETLEGVEVIQEANIGQIPRTTEFPGQVVKEIQRMEIPDVDPTEEILAESPSNAFSTQLGLEVTTIEERAETEVNTEVSSSGDTSERVDITFVPMVIKTPAVFKQESSLQAETQTDVPEVTTTTEKIPQTETTLYETEVSTQQDGFESKELPESTFELKSAPKITTEGAQSPQSDDFTTFKQNTLNKFGKPQKPVFTKPAKAKPPTTSKPFVRHPAKDSEKKPYENHLQSSPSVLELEAAPEENLGLEATVANLDGDVRRFAELCNELAFSLWSSVTHNGLSFVRSLVVSPFAVTSLLAMVFLGARGPTSGQMNDVLRLDDMVTFNPHLVFRNVTESVVAGRNPGVATAAFVRELYSDKSKGKLLDFYKERVQQFYDGHVEEVNFKTIGDTLRRQTNHLVKRQTWGKVTDFLRGANLMPRPPLAAFSANIFQTDCTWASTRDRDGEMYFVILPASRLRRLVPIPAVVWRDGFLAGYEPNLDATAVSISPSDSAISTIFVLPGQQGLIAPGDTLARLEHHLLGSPFKKGHWSRLMRCLLPRPGLELQIPRLSHKSVINVTFSLQRMGLKDLFSADKADLTGLNGLANDLHLSDMLQVNLFSTCGEEPIGSRHHSEVYPATPILRRDKSADSVFSDSLDNLFAISDLEDPAISALPLELRPRQARVPLSAPGVRVPEPPRLRFDRPFLFFVRHNPTGLILHMGRFNPRLMP